MHPTKRCRYCGRFLRPDPRAGNRQKACFRSSCRKRRKQEAQRAWVLANPDGFRDRYPNTRDWLKAHPGYLKRWREDRDIQDTISPPRPVKWVRLKYRPGQRVIYKTRSGWDVAIDAGFP